jgi:ABC-type oligopeptide transport system substrate-binding subunit
MKFIKTYTIKFLSILLLICLFCACTPNDNTDIIPPQNNTNQGTNENIKPISGGTLNIPINKNLYTLHPLYIKEAQTIEVFSIIFETLFTFDENFEPVNSLAQSYKFSEDENVLTIELHVE